MALKSILAAFAGDAASCSALRFAIGLQVRHRAHITGVVWHGADPVASRHRAYLTRGVSDMLATREAAAAQGIRAAFEARVAESGDPDRAGFIDLHALAEFSLPETARSYDLVVMSRHAAVVGHEHDVAHPDAVALRAGRPVVTVPDAYAGEVLAGPAVLAWDGRRAAARALGDALHVLGISGPVVVLSVGDRPPAPPEAGDDVLGLLARHGVEASALLRPTRRGGVARVILDACVETGAGLLIMGAYEHSKLSEDLLGGVTRSILADAPVPVLMAH